MAALSLCFWVAMSHPVWAQASTLGDVICNVVNNAKPFSLVFTWTAYVMGAVAIITGIYHLRHHTENPQNHPMHRGIMLFAGGAALMIMPSLTGAIVASLYGTQTAGATLGTCTAGSGGGSGAGLDGMMTNFVANIKGPILLLTSAAAMLSGLYMVIHGLHKASKYGFDPKTHSVHSILTNILFGCLLLTIGGNLNMMLSSVFGSTTVSDSSTLNWSFLSSLAGGSSTQFQNAVTAGLTFIQIIGAIAFVRGWLILKKVVEGGGNATMAQGLTHILGGVCAINIFSFLKAMDATFGTGMLS